MPDITSISAGIAAWPAGVRDLGTDARRPSGVRTARA